MIVVDYGNYLDQQALYADSLRRMTSRALRDRQAEQARALGDAAGAVYERLARMKRREVAIA